MFFPWGIFYDINVSLFKISILLLYRRVFSVPWLRVAVDINIAFITAFTITLVGKDVFACTPIRKQWMPELPGHCINVQATYYWASAVFLLTDLIILVLPQPLVWRLQISRKQKLGLTVVFCLGMMLVPLKRPAFFSWDSLLSGNRELASLWPPSSGLWWSSALTGSTSHVCGPR